MLQAGAMFVAFAAASLLTYATQRRISMSGYWFARAFPPFRLPVFIMGCCAAYDRLYALHCDERPGGAPGSRWPNQNLCICQEAR